MTDRSGERQECLDILRTNERSPCVVDRSRSRVREEVNNSSKKFWAISTTKIEILGFSIFFEFFGDFGVEQEVRKETEEVCRLKEHLRREINDENSSISVWVDW